MSATVLPPAVPRPRRILATFLQETGQRLLNAGNDWGQDLRTLAAMAVAELVLLPAAIAAFRAGPTVLRWRGSAPGRCRRASDCGSAHHRAARHHLATETTFSTEGEPEADPDGRLARIPSAPHYHPARMTPRPWLGPHVGLGPHFPEHQRPAQVSKANFSISYLSSETIRVRTRSTHEYAAGDA